MGEQEAKYSHDFSDEELGKMLYLWDDKSTLVIHEYLYMKKAWRNPEDEASGNKAAKETGKRLRQGAVDTGDRTIVDLSQQNGDPDDEDVVYLDLDTQGTVHIVEFYASWCPHCAQFKTEYIELAEEVARRSIGVAVQFHAVSCDLFQMICRAYGIKGFPVVLGYRMGMNMEKKGVELNPVDGPTMTAETIATILELSLANEPKNITSRNFTNSDDRRAYEEYQSELAKRAAEKKRAWHMHPSSLDERYHDAAVSLVFVLKNGVYTGTEESLDDIRALALKEFLELLDWTTPQSWTIRTGLIRDLLDNLHLVVSSSKNLVEIVERHVGVDTDNYLWGGIDNSENRQSTKESTSTLTLKNNKWTKACSHSERTLGFTCGLWNLLHISATGSSLPYHQLYGFLSGYLTAPADVGEIQKRFIEHFFGCEVCRQNFVNNYDECGQNHCERLPIIMPALEQDEEIRWKAHVEFSRWLLEMHNAVNIRLMRESAERENRVATSEEKLAAIFPPVESCPDCWLDETMTLHDSRRMTQFLHDSYWPETESKHAQFQTTLTRRLLQHSSTTMENARTSKYSWHPSASIAFALLFVVVIASICLTKRRHRSPITKTL